MQIPFIGGAYEQRSPSINAQKSINCFPVIDQNESKDVLAMYGTPGLKFFAKAVMYGSGEDGEVVISTDTTLTRDMQYSTLTVDVGVTLNVAGYVVSCSVLLTNNGIITDSDSGGNGGVGGIGYGNLGGYGQEGFVAGAGSGGDGGVGAGTVGHGGTGGKGGGIVRIFAKTLTNNGVIHANGFDATAPSASGINWGTGGGGGANGGNGGSVSLFYDARTVGTVTATAGAGSSYNPDLLNDDCSDLTYYTTQDIPNGISEVSPAGQFRFDTNSGTGGVAGRVKILTDYPTVNPATGVSIDGFTIDLKTYFDALGSTSRDGFMLGVWSELFGPEIFFYNSKMVTQLSGSQVEVGTNIVKCNASVTSQEYRIRYNYTDTVNPYVTVYLKDGGGLWVSQGSVNCKRSELMLGKRIYLMQYGLDTADRVSHIDYLKLSSGIVIDDGVSGSAGTTSWTNIPYFAFSSAEFRGAEVFNNTLYVVIGANVLTISTAGAVATIGSLTTSTGNVFLASNGTQILIVDGTVDGHYVTIATSAFTNVTLPVAATSCTFIDGFFVITELNSGVFNVSGLYDATSWDVLDFATAEGDPDNLLRCFHANSNLWLFGASTIEIWYNSGAAFPFVKVSGGLIQDGLASAAAISLIKDQFYFLSNKLEVLRTVGYQREKISTLHIDMEIQSYTTVSDAKSYEYRIDGHDFFVLTFPTADKTWVYDVITGYWHEWSSYKTQSVLTYGRHRGNIGFFFNNKWMIGDHTNGNIYELSMDTYTDDGELIPRTRRTQIVSKEKLGVVHHEIEINLESGVGLGGSGSGSDPVVYLRWSDDGANTWSNYYSKTLGTLGDYKKRLRWLRLGISRNRIYELTMTEPVKFVLLAAYERLEELKA
jgi:hypothetical protein